LKDWMPIFATQIWQLPYIALYILGLVFAFSRRDMGKAGKYAAAGFALLLLGTLVAAVQQYVIMSARMSGDVNAYRLNTMMMGSVVATQVCRFGGMGLLLAAIFAKRPAPSPVQ
jgi:hypothetical protein